LGKPQVLGIIVEGGVVLTGNLQSSLLTSLRQVPVGKLRTSLFWTQNSEVVYLFHRKSLHVGRTQHSFKDATHLFPKWTKGNRALRFFF